MGWLMYLNLSIPLQDKVTAIIATDLHYEVYLTIV